MLCLSGEEKQTTPDHSIRRQKNQATSGHSLYSAINYPSSSQISNPLPPSLQSSPTSSSTSSTSSSLSSSFIPLAPVRFPHSSSSNFCSLLLRLHLLLRIPLLHLLFVSA